MSGRIARVLRRRARAGIPGARKWRPQAWVWRQVQYQFARSVVRGAGLVLTGVGFLALAVLYAVALWKIPAWMGLEGKGGDAKDRHNARLLVVSAGGAVVVATSLLYTVRSYRLNHRGQVTDRFTKALERLSSTDIDARLGGIHALAHVAHDSRPHHDDVVEVLEAFIRRRAPQARPKEDGPTLAPRLDLPKRPDSDVQAALTALGRRPHRPERRQIDLSQLHLTRARLADLDLNHTRLRNANLGYADLGGADLRNTNLGGADVGGADLMRANLEGAYLEGADLTYADLTHAKLQGAYLVSANLMRANLTCANLEGAYLTHANLEHANLEHANLRNVRGMQPEEIRAVARVDEHTQF